MLRVEIGKSKYYTPREIAQEFGVSMTAVNNWLHQGELKGFRVGRSWRIREDDLSNFIEHSTLDRWRS